MTDAPTTRTLHLTNAYHPTSGGVRAVYRALLTTANALGRPVRMVVPGPANSVEEVGRFGRIYFVKAPRAFAVDRRYRLIMPTRYLLPWVQGIRQILQHEQPDVIEVCDKHSLPYIAGLLRKEWVRGVRRPTLVATSAERFDDNLSTFLGHAAPVAAFGRWYMRSIYAPMFDFHLANSEYTARELRAALPPHRQHVVDVCPPGLRAEAFQLLPGDDTREALLGLSGGNRQTRLLTYVGRLSAEKNLGLLVDMLEALVSKETANGPNYRIVLAGEGPERVRLEAARARVPGRLHLLGNLSSGTAVRRLLASTDVFVHPNPREPFGIAPLEAMAAGLPLVVPDSGGVLSYADTHTAWLARPTARAFAEAVRAVFEQPALTAARTAAARNRAAAFHEGLVVPRFFSLLDALHRRRVTDQAATTPEVIGGAVPREAATSR